MASHMFGKLAKQVVRTGRTDGVIVRYWWKLSLVLDNTRVHVIKPPADAYPMTVSGIALPVSTLCLGILDQQPRVAFKKTFIYDISINILPKIGYSVSYEFTWKFHARRWAYVATSIIGSIQYFVPRGHKCSPYVVCEFPTANSWSSLSFQFK